MGTDKRERQKQNRAMRREEELKRERNKAVKRRVVRISIAVFAALAGVVFIAWLGGAFDGGGTSPATTAPPAGDETATGAEGDAAVGCPDPEGESQRRQFDAPPPMCLEDGVQYSAVVTTNFGSYTIELDAEAAPLTVNNFVVLARYRYFDDTRCHRIIPGFVVQCGDPTATGTGGPGYRFDDELPEAGAYELGSVAMANSGPNTNGSQFFVISGPQGEALPPAYSLFGQVVDGLDVIAELDEVGSADGTPVQPVQIRSIEIIES